MHKRNLGFSMMELMFTVAVMAMLLAVGVPNFRDLTRNARMTDAANAMIGHAHLARSEAIKRRVTVSVCSGNAVEDPECDGESFGEGWIVFVDEDGDGDFDAGTDELITSRDALPATITSVVTEPGVDDPDDPDDGGWVESDVAAFTYAANGFRSEPGGGLPPGIAITLCDARGNLPSASGPDISAARMVELTAIGRAAVSRRIDAIDARGGCPEE